MSNEETEKLMKELRQLLTVVSYGLTSLTKKSFDEGPSQMEKLIEDVRTLRSELAETKKVVESLLTSQISKVSPESVEQLTSALNAAIAKLGH